MPLTSFNTPLHNYYYVGVVIDESLEQFYGCCSANLMQFIPPPIEVGDFLLFSCSINDIPFFSQIKKAPYKYIERMLHIFVAFSVALFNDELLPRLHHIRRNIRYIIMCYLSFRLNNLNVIRPASHVLHVATAVIVPPTAEIR